MLVDEITPTTALADPVAVVRTKTLASGILLANGDVGDFSFYNFNTNDSSSSGSTAPNEINFAKSEISMEFSSSSGQRAGSSANNNLRDDFPQHLDKDVDCHRRSKPVQKIRMDYQNSQRKGVLLSIENHSGALVVSGEDDEICSLSQTVAASSLSMPSDCDENEQLSDSITSKVRNVTFFSRQSSSFLRVSDLSSITSVTTPPSLSKPKLREMCSELTDTTIASEDYDDSWHGSDDRGEKVEVGTNIANFHYPSNEPPPGVVKESDELWIALVDGTDGRHSPLAAAAVSALEEFGRSQVCFNEAIWTPADRLTEKASHCVRNFGAKQSWQSSTFCADGMPSSDSDCSTNKSVLVWYGKLSHGYYGNDIPLVRAAGMIDVSPESLLELLLDSNRVTEYNEMSLGRTDILVLQKDMPTNVKKKNINVNAFGGITKIWRSSSRPPIVRKTMQFTSLVHARELPDHSGYIIVSRSVNTMPDKTISDALTAEILLNINVLKRVDGETNQCLFISVNHVRSPILIPNMIAKRVAIQGVTGFIQDLRKCTSKNVSK